jgi:hypothetical protein
MRNLHQAGAVAQDQKLHVLLIAQGLQPTLNSDSFIDVIFKAAYEDPFHDC